VGIERHLGEAKSIKSPLALHFAGEDKFVDHAAVAKIKKAFAQFGKQGRPEVETYVYPGVDHGFNNHERAAYNRPAAWMAHSRTIALFRKAMGPHYDLSTLWDAHTFYEFGARDVDATMKTMVAEPYVNHIPTMTGGVGAKDLARFYADFFIPRCPKDT